MALARKKERTHKNVKCHVGSRDDTTGGFVLTLKGTMIKRTCAYPNGEQRTGALAERPTIKVPQTQSSSNLNNATFATCTLKSVVHLFEAEQRMFEQVPNQAKCSAHTSETRRRVLIECRTDRQWPRAIDDRQRSIVSHCARPRSVWTAGLSRRLTVCLVESRRLDGQWN